jgi:EmrB/QacA subfamily drug resistance transporter
MTSQTMPATDRTPPPDHKPHSALALTVIAAAQLMVVLDATITNIALPSIQTDLKVSAANLSWIVNSYALAFGSLLLLGGKSGDLFGRRRMFRIGILLFSVASVLGGLATDETLLIGARVLQGVGGAIAAPTALSLIAVNFPEGPPRNRAMGVYAAMAGLGSTVGLLLGGVLTDLLSWRWVFFVNVPIGILVLVGTLVLSEGDRNRGRLDIPGALMATAGLLSLVYGITRGGQHGWSDGLTLVCFAAAVVLLTGFIGWQRRASEPMMPLRLFASRSRSGAYATMLLIGSGMFATFYFLTLYMQLVQGYSPVRTGLAYLPFSVGMGIAAATSSKLVARVQPRLLAGPGLLIAATGMGWLGGLAPHSSYWTHLMPAMFITALGLGLSFVPMTLSAVSQVRDQDTGIASALLNTSQQVGGALGLAILTTVATNAANHQLPDAAASFFRGVAMRDPAMIQAAGAALTHGYTCAFLVVNIFFIVAAVIVLRAITAGPASAEAATTGHASCDDPAMAHICESHVPGEINGR